MPPSTDLDQSEDPEAKPQRLKRRKKAVALGSALSGLTNRALARRGLAGANLIKDWATIVGSHLSTLAVPDRISWPKGSRAGGTLILRVGSGAMALEVQHLEPLILERINGHFGYRAVNNLKLLQGVLPHTVTRKEMPRRPLGKQEQATLNHQVGDIQDNDLRDALEKLGRSILTKPEKGENQASSVHLSPGYAPKAPEKG